MRWHTLQTAVIVGSLLIGGSAFGQQFPTPSADAIRRASLQEVDAALAILDERISQHKGALKVLIPRTTHLTGLHELWRDYPFGFLDPEIDGMARAQGAVLAKEENLYGSGYDAANATSDATRPAKVAATESGPLWMVIHSLGTLVG